MPNNRTSILPELSCLLQKSRKMAKLSSLHSVERCLSTLIFYKGLFLNIVKVQYLNQLEMTYSGRLQMNPNCLKDQELKLMNAFIKRSAFTMKSFCSETKIEKEEKKVFFCQFFSPVHQLFMFLLLKSYWTRDRFVSIQKIGSSCSTSLYFCLVLVFFLFFILFLLFSLRVGQ